MSLSCIIPNYNHEKYLAERIESVLGQSFSKFECIYLDDYSIDYSNVVFSKYVNNDNRISSYFNQKNSGSTFCQWNRGVQYARGKFITIQESDDVANIDLFETLYNEIDKNENIVLAFCQSNIIDCHSRVVNIWEYESSDFDNSFIMEGTDFISKYLIHKNVIPNASAVMFRKEIYDLVGGANPSLKSNGDWLVWLKILCHGKIAFINKPLNNYRRHEDTVTYRARQSNLICYNEIYSSTLRKEFTAYLKKFNLPEFSPIININKKYISYEAGNYSFFLLKKKKYIKSVKHLLIASFYGGFKSYFLKKYLRDFNSCLFNK